MKQWAKIVLAVLVCLSLAGCGSYDKNAEKGLLDGRTAEEVAELETQQVADGMLQVSINSNPVFLNGTEPGNLRIENAPGNPYDMRVTIRLADGQAVYESGCIKPNYHIENATLTVALAAGDYPATASFYAVKDGKDIGVVTQEITLTVLE